MHARLTAGQAWEIHQLAWHGVDPGEIAARYGISRGTVSSIKHGHSWWRVTGESGGLDMPDVAPSLAS